MFKLQLSPTYFAPATLAHLNAEGKLIQGKFDCQFRRLPKEEMADMATRLNSGEITDAEFFDKVMVGWRAVADADGQPVTFSKEALEQACKTVDGFGRACAKAYFDSVQPTAAAHLSAKN